MSSRTIAGAVRRKKRELKHPNDLDLTILLEWVRTYDPDFKGLSNEVLCIKSCGDDEQGKKFYKEATSEGDSNIVRGFCVMRMENAAKKAAETNGESTEKELAKIMTQLLDFISKREL